MAKSKGPAGKVSMKHSTKDADARKNASFAGLCGKAGDPTAGGGKAPGVGSGSKNVKPPNAHSYASFAGVGGGKNKSTV